MRRNHLPVDSCRGRFLPCLSGPLPPLPVAATPRQGLPRLAFRLRGLPGDDDLATIGREIEAAEAAWTRAYYAAAGVADMAAASARVRYRKARRDEAHGCRAARLAGGDDDHG